MRLIKCYSFHASKHFSGCTNLNISLQSRVVSLDGSRRSLVSVDCNIRGRSEGAGWKKLQNNIFMRFSLIKYSE